jgi:hypothetical protein
MNTNLDKIALDLYGKIQTRFPDIKIGDENAEVLSKKSDIPAARFFEFEYEENGEVMGTVAITLDEDDGIVVQISGNLADSNHHGAFKFIRSFRQFAKDRLLKFDVQNIGKDNLDKRDYHFRAKPKEEMMEPMMESKMYGTARMSYQDLGEAKIIVKHSQPINLELPAGRTMHIESIYVENSQGERFKYPFKHLGGARALAEHLKHGGIPYDAIGKHITGLSEELAQLRKFKGYVSRNEALSEAMGDITTKVFERIEQVKKEVHGLSRKAYYEQFAESFTESEEQMIPEEIMTDWIDRLTIRTFNEELRTAFPFIFKLVDESNIPVKELSADDLLGEKYDEKKEQKHAAKTTLKHIDNPSEDDKEDAKNIKPGSYKDRHDMLSRAKAQGKLKDVEESQFESFLDKIVNEDGEVEDTLFSPNKSVQQQAIQKLNKILSAELKGGPDATNAIQSLKGIIDDPAFVASLKDIDSDLDVRPLIQQFILSQDASLANQLKFDGGDEIGGQDLEAPQGAAEMPPPEAPVAPAAPEAPAAPLPAEVPPMAESEDPPFDGPYTKNKGTITDKSGAKHTGRSQARHLARQGLIKAIHTAKDHGAKLDTTLDFGHKEMTLHDCIEECGMSPADFGFDMGQQDSGIEQMLKSVAGFWNPQEKNFTIGGTRAKTKVVKDFKNGEFENASEEELAKVLKLIDKMDPSGNEHNQIMRLSGIPGHEHAIDEDPADDDFSQLMTKFQQDHGDINIDQLLDKWQQANPDAKVTRSNTSSGTIDGKPASYDDAMNKFKGMAGNMGFDASGDDPIGGMMKGIQGKVGGMMKDMPTQAPGTQMNPQDMMKQLMGKINFGN